MTMRSFTPCTLGDAVPLGNTITKAGQGIAGTASFMAGVYPACSEHGAMNKVASAPLWRCLTCNIGVQLTHSVIPRALDDLAGHHAVD